MGNRNETDKKVVFNIFAIVMHLVEILKLEVADFTKNEALQV